MAGPAGGVVPYERNFPGGGFVRVRGAAPGTQGVYPGSGPWQLPPIPPGYYNPMLDVQASEGKLGTEQTLSGLNRQKTDAENNYATNLGLLGQREADQAQKQKETLALLGESYKKLGVQQGGQANATGTLYGGAMISSAMKRAANEGSQKARDEAARAEQVQANQNERGRLSTQENQLLGPGGSLLEAITNAERSQQLYGQNINTLKGTQAAEHGYTPEQAGGVVPYERNYPGGGSVRVGMPR
jgi:hypothetical protein